MHGRAIRTYTMTAKGTCVNLEADDDRAHKSHPTPSCLLASLPVTRQSVTVTHMQERGAHPRMAHASKRISSGTVRGARKKTVHETKRALTFTSLGAGGDVHHLSPVPEDGALLDGERLEHGHGLGGLHDPAQLARRRRPPVGDPEHARPGPGRRRRLIIPGCGGGEGDLGGAAVPDGGDERRVVRRAQVEVRGGREHGVPGVGLGLVPEAARQAHHGRVVRLRVGGADGARLAVRGAPVVEQVEPLQEQHARAAGGRRVRRAAAHDARAHHDHVEPALAVAALAVGRRRHGACLLA